MSDFILLPFMGALLSGYVTGWLVAAPIGPVNLEIIRRTLRFGWRHGLALGGGAVVIDLLYFTTFTMGIGALMQGRTAAVLLNLVGGAFLAWLALRASREALLIWTEGRNPADQLRGSARDAELRSDPTPRSSFATGLVLTGANPITVAFWSALSIGFAGQEASLRLFSSAGVVAGCASWVLLLVGLMTLARQRVGPKLFSIMTGAGALCLYWFAARSFLRLLG